MHHGGARSGATATLKAGQATLREMLSLGPAEYTSVCIVFLYVYSVIRLVLLKNKIKLGLTQALQIK